MPIDVHPLMSPPLPPSTPPPSSPTSLPTDALPSSTSSSLHSLRTALSEAASLSLSHSHRDSHSNSNALLFSPESRKSAATDGTGATGSTEQEGAATRSLVMSVEGKMHQPRERASDVSSASVLSAGSWDQAQSLLGSPRMGPPAVRMPALAEMLPTPEPEGVQFAPRKEEKEEEEEEVRIKQESDDGFDDSSENPLPSAFLTTVKQEEEEDDHYQHDDDHPARPLTNSQEDALLSSSVTRSQSDFNAWLDNTLRHARGDGTGSVIESDDALSSILLLSTTRRSTGRQPSFGAFSSISASGSLSFSGALGGGEAPISPPESETASFLDGGDDEEEREEEQEKEEPSEVEMEDLAAPVEVEEEEKVDGEEKVEQLERDDTPTDAASSTSSSLLRWKLLTLTLSLALIYQTFFRPLPPPVTITEIEIVEVPTTPSRYIPINDSLISTSHFATPIPLGGEGVGLGGYALLFTLLAGAVASIPLIRNARRLKEDDEKDGEAATSSRSRSRASSPLAELNAADFSLAQQLLRRGIDDYSSRRLALAREHFSAVLPLACGAPLKSHASEWLGRTLYRLARADVGSPSSKEQMREAVKAFERAVRLDPSRATPRASWGRALYRLREYERAVLVLRAAVKRGKEGEVAFTHEWLAKALVVAVNVEEKEGKTVTVQIAKEVEKHLLRAIEVASSSSTAGEEASASHAFLAAHLLSTPSLRTPPFPSPQSRLAAALIHLTRAVSLRPAYPAAHALLARVYGCEALDTEKAAEHWRAVVETRFVAGVERDEAIEAVNADVGEWVKQATRGWAPWKGWVFATEKGGRREVLRRAAKEASVGGMEEDELLSLLLLVEEVTVEREEIEGPKTRTPKRKTRSTTPTAVEPADPSPALQALQSRTSTLQARCARFPLLLSSSSSEDILVHGLYAVALLALNQGVGEEAEEVFGAFWSAVLAEGTPVEVRREAAWVARAFWELKQGSEAPKEEKMEEVSPAVKVVKKLASTPTPTPTATTTATRRITRASSGTPTPASAAKGKGRGKRVEKVEEEEEDAVTVMGAAEGEEREEVVEEVKPVLRRSPRKAVKKEVE